jgi:1-phosphofructokinase
MTPDVVTVTLNPAIDWTLEVPRFTTGAVNRVVAERFRAGGKGGNVAAALAGYSCADLDAHVLASSPCAASELPRFRVTASGFLGRENVAAFETFLAEKSIGDEFVRVGGATRVGIKIFDPENQQTTDINFAGAAVSAGEVRELEERLFLLARKKPYFVLAGSVPPGVDASIYARLIAQLKRADCRVALDTSGEALQSALEARPDFVKPNLHELQGLVGTSLHDEQSVLAAARTIVSRGIELVVVSMGEKGALFVTPSSAVAARPPSMAVNSSVGAGDAMVAGIVAAQMEGLSLRELALEATLSSLRALTAERSDAGRLSREIIIEEVRSDRT